jgi:hypothetical protein
LSALHGFASSRLRRTAPSAQPDWQPSDLRAFATCAFGKLKEIAKEVIGRRRNSRKAKRSSGREANARESSKKEAKEFVKETRKGRSSSRSGKELARTVLEIKEKDKEPVERAVKERIDKD